MIPARAVVEWAALAVALGDVTPPCAVDPDRWFPEPREAVDHQVTLCVGCPVVMECLAFAVAAKESSGVWGGRLFGRGGC